MNMGNNSSLEDLLGSYLHQDFLDEFPTAMDAVRNFVSGVPLESVHAAPADIARLQADERFTRSPDSTLFDLGCSDNPRSEGMTMIEWLQQVQRALRNASR